MQKYRRMRLIAVHFEDSPKSQELFEQYNIEFSKCLERLNDRISISGINGLECSFSPTSLHPLQYFSMAINMERTSVFWNFRRG